VVANINTVLRNGKEKISGEGSEHKMGGRKRRKRGRERGEMPPKAGKGGRTVSGAKRSGKKNPGPVWKIWEKKQ